MDVVGVEGEVADGSAGDERAAPAGECEREPHPSDSLRTFGAVVQALREHAGLSRADLGARVQYSKHTVESVELGRRMPDEAFVERAEEALGNTGALRKAARHLTRGEAGLAAWFRRWARLEREAVSLCTYECRLVPGLLQSEAYARAVFDNSIPLLTDEQTEAQVWSPNGTAGDDAGAADRAVRLHRGGGGAPARAGSSGRSGSSAPASACARPA
ncbi:hypothetical protein SFUMM280S_07698 [Streptomyces fumanus]